MSTPARGGLAELLKPPSPTKKKKEKVDSVALFHECEHSLAELSGHIERALETDLGNPEAELQELQELIMDAATSLAAPDGIAETTIVGSGKELTVFQRDVAILVDTVQSPHTRPPRVSLTRLP